MATTWTTGNHFIILIVNIREVQFADNITLTYNVVVHLKLYLNQTEHTRLM